MHGSRGAVRLLSVGRLVHEVLHAAKCKKPFAEVALQTPQQLQGVSSQAGDQGPAAPTGEETAPLVPPELQEAGLIPANAGMDSPTGPGEVHGSGDAAKANPERDPGEFPKLKLLVWEAAEADMAFFGFFLSARVSEKGVGGAREVAPPLSTPWGQFHSAEPASGAWVATPVT